MRKNKKILLITLLFGVAIVLDSCFTFRQSDKSAIKEFKKIGIDLRLNTLVINQRNLHYATVGNDSLPTLVFVHGSPGGWIEFKPYLKDTSLLSRFRIMSIDRPGFGYSDYGQAMHLQPQADIVGEFLKLTYNTKPIYLIGHSYGGPLVALVSADYPKYVTRMVIIAGALSLELEAKEKWRTFFLHRPMRYLMPGSGKQANEELWYLKKDLVGLKPKLSTITSPTYVLHATNDMLVDYRNAAFMKKEFISASVEVMTFTTGNHFIHHSRHQAIDSLLIGFRGLD
jgi:pimeloyl-ACP methyl ester carboxylesterase